MPEGEKCSKAVENRSTDNHSSIGFITGSKLHGHMAVYRGFRATK